jgi:hypothetical protein
MHLWNKDIEIRFFEEALKCFASREQLFYKIDDCFYAYAPKGYSTKGQTLQSRNTLIGNFTEKWCKGLMEPIAKKHSMFAVNGVICEELGLTKQSPADLAICTKDSIVQKPENIKLIFEIKMSIVSNYMYNENVIKYIGDYKTHKGNPSLLRSDSMLKAIGKSVNIRVSGNKSATIPIVILGNSPITLNYEEKVEHLTQSGVIQHFISVNPNPTESEFVKQSKNKGFITPNDYSELETICDDILKNNYYYFSGMKNKNELGEIILMASNEKSEIECAEKFLELIKTKI